jgi:predicted phosphodiesterase
MRQIFVTGDIHGDIGIRKLTTRHFPQQEYLSKNDYVIILGDFGCIWNGEPKDKYWLNWLEAKPFTTLFLDGNHENFDLLYQYPTGEWNDGKVRRIRPSVLHLTRGQVFELEGLKLFTMGGGTSIDKQFRKEGVSWWPQEQPSEEEYAEAERNLDRVGWEVDVVLTHTASIKRMIEMDYMKEKANINLFFDKLEEKLKFKVWYFGHFHEERNMKGGKFRARYNSIEKLETGILRTNT